MVHKAGRQGSDGRPTRRPQRFARGVYYFHRWLGVAGTAVLVIICITGILLNHKRPLGLMPDVPNEPSGAFSDAKGLSELAGIAASAVEVAREMKERLNLLCDIFLAEIGRAAASTA